MKLKSKLWQYIPIVVGLGILIYGIIVRISHHYSFR